VKDQLYIGGEHAFSPNRQVDHYSAPFLFGCQVKLTGLFIPQTENGIMGLSNGPDNFVRQLKDAVSSIYTSILEEAERRGIIAPFPYFYREGFPKRFSPCV